MNITVLMASGDEDTWEDAADALNDRGALIVLAHIEGDEVSGNIKTMEISREIPQDNPQFEGKVHVPEPMVKTETFQVCAEYAPGMWMKVEFG